MKGGERMTVKEKVLEEVSKLIERPNPYFEECVQDGKTKEVACFYCEHKELCQRGEVLEEPLTPQEQLEKAIDLTEKFVKEKVLDEIEEYLKKIWYRQISKAKWKELKENIRK